MVWMVLACTALVAGACSTSDSEEGSVATSSREASQVDDEPEPADEPVALPSGAEAIAAAHGKPHVLWFWGAH